MNEVRKLFQTGGYPHLLNIVALDVPADCLFCVFGSERADEVIILLWRFHNPPNSDMDYRIFNVRMRSFFMRIHTGDLGLQSHPKDFCSLHRIRLRRNLRAGAKSRT